jgi:hypothetical protein
MGASNAPRLNELKHSSSATIILYPRVPLSGYTFPDHRRVHVSTLVCTVNKLNKAPLRLFPCVYCPVQSRFRRCRDGARVSPNFRQDENLDVAMILLLQRSILSSLRCSSFLRNFEVSRVWEDELALFT